MHLVATSLIVMGWFWWTVIQGLKAVCWVVSGNIITCWFSGK